jgi:dTDP-glucose pyrophosphorylase
MSRKSIYPSKKIRDAVEAIENNLERIVVVVSQINNELLGTITDGDIRRHILNNGSLDESVTKVMNKKPVIAKIEMSDSVIQKLCLKNNIRGIPLVDEQNKFIRLVYKDDDLKDSISDNRTFGAAVIMAGGEGMRLRPVTLKIPKPMVEINGIPLLERQISNLRSIGIEIIYLAVNYLGEVIKDYFGDGQNFGVKIKYINETIRLGTAGALGLIPELNIKEPVLVMNGDILTTSDFSHIYQFHLDQDSDITVTAKDYYISIPYGVINYEGARIKSIQEKPSQRFFCNAGIYALSSKMINNIKSNTFLNMTDVIEKCISDGGNVSVFPLHEYWSDIGTEQDLQIARSKFQDK